LEFRSSSFSKAKMVYYFTTRCGGYTIYMGKDKYENEDLIKYGLPEDCWFHVDDLSSAHGELTVDLWWKFIIWKYTLFLPPALHCLLVYLRLKPGMTLVSHGI
jgi:hypothetical protein